MLNARALLALSLIFTGCGDVCTRTVITITNPTMEVNNPPSSGGEEAPNKPATYQPVPRDLVPEVSPGVQPSSTTAMPATGEATTEEPGCTIGASSDVGFGRRGVVAGNDLGFAIAYSENDAEGHVPGAFAQVFNQSGVPINDRISLRADAAQYGIGVSIGSSSDRFYPMVGSDSSAYLHEMTADGEVLAITNAREYSYNFYPAIGVQDLALWVTRDERGCASLNRGAIDHGITDVTHYDNDCAGMNPRFAASNANASATVNWLNVGNDGLHASIVILGNQGTVTNTTLFTTEPRLQYAQLHGLIAINDGFVVTWTLTDLHSADEAAPPPAPRYMATINNDGSIRSVSTLPEADGQLDQHWATNGNDLGVVSRRYPQGNTGEVVFRRFSFEGALLQETIVASNVGQVYEITATSLAASGDNYAILWHVPVDDVVGNHNAAIKLATVTCRY